MRYLTPLAAALIAVAGLASPLATAPAAAQIDARDPGQFVDSLAERGFTVLTGNRAQARGQFRSLLAQHFAVDTIGDNLIRQWRPRITAQQYQQYKAAFPNFIIGTYADRLYDYAGADLEVVRVQNSANAAAVLTRVTKPGAQPVNVIWSLAKIGPTYKVTNLTVSGINLAMAQRADFNSYIQRRGFDGLLTFMRSRG